MSIRTRRLVARRSPGGGGWPGLVGDLGVRGAVAIVLVSGRGPGLKAVRTAAAVKLREGTPPRLVPDRVFAMDAPSFRDTEVSGSARSADRRGGHRATGRR